MGAPEHIIDERDAEVELACMFGLELTGLELDNDMAGYWTRCRGKAAT